MILKLFLDISLFMISFITRTISNALPNIEVIRYYKTFLQLLSGILHTAINFIYFVIGEAMFPLLTVAIIMLVYRYLLFPVIVIARRIIVKGGDE